MKTIVDITLAYPPDAPFAIDPFELLSLLRRHRQPLRIYFHVRSVVWSIMIEMSCVTQRTHIQPWSIE